MPVFKQFFPNHSMPPPQENWWKTDYDILQRPMRFPNRVSFVTKICKPLNLKIRIHGCINAKKSHVALKKKSSTTHCSDALLNLHWKCIIHSQWKPWKLCHTSEMQKWLGACRKHNYWCKLPASQSLLRKLLISIKKKYRIEVVYGKAVKK